jgi:multiple sugar transport system substrate-binding protein
MKSKWSVASLMVAGITTLVIAFSAPAFAAAPAATEFSGELSLWSGYPEMAPLYDKIIADFHAKYPKVKVSYLTHPLREYEQKLAATIPTDSGPDVFEGSLYANLKFIEAGLLPEAPAGVLDQTKGMHDNFLVDYNTIKGKRYGIPFFEGRPAIFYNKDCLKEAGLREPAADKPMDWPTFIQYAQKTAKRDAAGKVTRSGLSLRLSGAGSGIAEKFWIIGMPHGLDALAQNKEGKWKAAYNNEAGQKTLQMYIDMLYKWKTDSHDLKHDAEAFELGIACMFQRETWVVGDIAQKAPNLSYGTMPLAKDTDWKYLRNSFSLYVARSTKDPRLAWEFTLFMIRPEYQKFMLDRVGWLPSRKDVDYSEVFAKKPAFKAFLVADPAYKSTGTPRIGVFDEIWTKLAERLSMMYLDKSLVDNPAGMKKALGDAAAETNTILKREKVYGE